MKTTTAERLREIMSEQNLKQADIIERAKPLMKEYDAKLTRPDISQYCSGKVKPTQDKMFLLAAALDVSEAWLMGYEVPRTRTKAITDMAHTQPMMSLLQGEYGTIAETYIENAIKKVFHISSDEYDLIVAYRKANPDRQDSVRCLLGIENKEKNKDVG